MKEQIKMTTIEIYPECPRPDWLKVGAWCYCWGEGQDRFIVQAIGKNAALLVHEEYIVRVNKHGKQKTGKRQVHGWESFSKLHR